MNKVYREAFSAVLDFVEDIVAEFKPKKGSALNLYARLVEKITFKDTDAINKVLGGFRSFIVGNDHLILEDHIDKIQDRIHYGENERIFIDVVRFYRNSDAEARNIIRQHLLTIYAILEEDIKAKEALKSAPPLKANPSEITKTMFPELDENSNEGKFVNSIFGETQRAMEGSNPSNPLEAIMSVMGSGGIQEIMASLGSGDVDMGKLIGSMSGMFSGFAKEMSKEAIDSTDEPEFSSGAKIEEIIEKLEDGKSFDTRYEFSLSKTSDVDD